MSAYNRRRFLQHSGSMVLLGATSGMAALPRAAFAQDATVKLGLLHSLSAPSPSPRRRWWTPRNWPSWRSTPRAA